MSSLPHPNRNRKSPVHCACKIVFRRSRCRPTCWQYILPWIFPLTYQPLRVRRLIIPLLPLSFLGSNNYHNFHNFLPGILHRNSATRLSVDIRKFRHKQQSPEATAYRSPVPPQVFPAWIFPISASLYRHKKRCTGLHRHHGRLVRFPGNILRGFWEYHNGWHTVRRVCRSPYRKQWSQRSRLLFPLGTHPDCSNAAANPYRHDKGAPWYRLLSEYRQILPPSYGSNNR